MDKPLWKPAEGAPSQQNMLLFMEKLGADTGTAIGDTDALHTYSIENPEKFWRAVWDFGGVIGDPGPSPWLIDVDRMPGARFFPGAKLNFAENLLRGEGEAPAIIFRGENGARRELSWNDLREQVSSLQQWLKAQGVGEGDRVAAMLPNVPEAVIGMLATTSIGAIWSSCSPDFGVQGVLDRFGQIEPKVFMACDGYYYGGKTLDLREKVAGVVAELPSARAALITNFIGKSQDTAEGLDRAVAWDDALAAHPPAALTFERMPFEHPIYILFSSGTTGVPKCIVHCGGGVLLQHLKEHLLHCGIQPGERLFYFTTCGWMMWNWLVSGLAGGATLMLYDGSPFHPDGNVLFDFVQDEKIAIFGTSAKFIDAVKTAGLRPRDTHDLSAMRMIASTGSPLVPEGFDFVYEAIQPDVHLASISGGTDIVACFVLGNPMKPVWRGEIQGPGLGMAVAVYDEEGRPLSSGKGELVCTKPFPSMPVGFWNDPDGKKYRGAYFERFPNIWHHGDYAEWTEHGGMIIHGRSDATLNPGGVRIGTAEIYRQVERFDEIAEAIVIGQQWKGDTRIVLFVVMQKGATLDDALRDRIKQRIREQNSPRHVPAVILDVADIPRTKSGKITELAVRDIVHGREVKNKEALANPEALEYFRDRTELAG